MINTRFSKFYHQSVQIQCKLPDQKDVIIQIVSCSFGNNSQLDQYPFEIAQRAIVSAFEIESCPI